MKQTANALLFLFTYISHGNQASVEECNEIGPHARLCVLRSKVTFDQAKASCNSLGNWAVSSDGLTTSQPQEYVITENLPVWLNLRKKTFSNWTGLNGEPASNDLHFNGNGRTGASNCTAIQVQDDSLVPIRCTTRGEIGFVCESTGNCIWPLKSNCFRLKVNIPKTVCVGYAAFVLSWTAARALCIQYRGDLVVPSSHQEVVAIKNFIANITRKREQSSNGFYFTGIIKELWSTTGDTGLPQGKLAFVSWAPEEPRNGNCAINTKEGWKSISCDSKQAAICQRRTFVEEEDERNASVQNQAEKFTCKDEPHSQQIQKLTKVTYAILTLLCICTLVLLAEKLYNFFRGKVRLCGKDKYMPGKGDKDGESSRPNEQTHLFNSGDGQLEKQNEENLRKTIM